MKIPPKPKRGKRSPFYWWRRWKSHKYLPTKKGLLARILNGDFEYPDQFEWAKYETHYMQDELDAFVKNYKGKIHMRIPDILKYKDVMQNVKIS